MGDLRPLIIPSFLVSSIERDPTERGDFDRLDPVDGVDGVTELNLAERGDRDLLDPVDGVEGIWMGGVWDDLDPTERGEDDLLDLVAGVTGAAAAPGVSSDPTDSGEESTEDIERDLASSDCVLLRGISFLEEDGSLVLDLHSSSICRAREMYCSSNCVFRIMYAKRVA